MQSKASLEELESFLVSGALNFVFNCTALASLRKGFSILNLMVRFPKEDQNEKAISVY